MSEAVRLNALAKWLRSEILAAPKGDLALLAGHYAVFTSGGLPVDLLDADPLPMHAPVELLEFTKFTWDAACEAMAGTRGHAARLLVLVDDIQFVQPAMPNLEMRERLAAALVESYLGSLPRLPDYHTRALRTHELADECVMRHSEHRWLFSERELRIQLVRHLKHTFRAGRLGSGELRVAAAGDAITLIDPDYGEYSIVQSGHTTCAGGYLELLAELQRRSVRQLIALVPMRCFGTVATGTALASRLGFLGGCSVVNVGVPDLRSNLPAAVARDID
jgi:hypothetical protein